LKTEVQKADKVPEVTGDSVEEAYCPDTAEAGRVRTQSQVRAICW
jgi:hypothetical protein